MSSPLRVENPVPFPMSRAPSTLRLDVLREGVRFACSAVLTFFHVLGRRLFFGRGHPAWGFRKELVTRLMRTTFERMITMSPATMRARELATPMGFRQRRGLLHRHEALAGIPVETFTPKRFAANGMTVLYFPGGGYVACSPRTHRDLLSRIAFTSGARCLAVAYRKAPECPFPAGIDDGEQVYRALLAAGVAPEQLIVAGDSAGAGLALALLQRIRAAALPLPSAAVLLSPWVDLTLRGPSLRAHAAYDYLTPLSLSYAVEHYLQGCDPRHPEASALYADLTGMPPLFVQTGGAELFYSENEEFVARARSHGVDVTFQVRPGMAHVCANFARYVPECARAVDEVAAYVRSRHASAGAEAAPARQHGDLLALEGDSLHLAG